MGLWHHWGIGFILVLVMTFGFPEFQTKTQQNKKVGIEKALLALLRANVYEWRKKTNLHGVRRLLDGRSSVTQPLTSRYCS